MNLRFLLTLLVIISILAPVTFGAGRHPRAISIAKATTRNPDKLLLPSFPADFRWNNAAGPRPNDYTVTVSGSFFCHDGSSSIDSPLAGARVELMDSDCDGSTICDDEMGHSYVNDDGSFSITGTGGDPGDYSWSRPDVYVRIVYNDDQGVRLTDELNRDQYADTPEHDHNNVANGSAIDFGSWTTGVGVSPGEGSKCGVWLAARRSFRDYISLIGSKPPSGTWDVEYWSGIWTGTPWTNDDTTHWPIHYSSTAARHEFGHLVRHAADGDRNHFNWDVTRFRYARNHSRCDANSNRIGTDTHTMGLAYGFNEGWAEFWDGETSGCWAVTIDDESEGNNAFALGVLANSLGVGKAGLVAVLKAHPGEIHSLDDFIRFMSSTYSMTTSTLRQAITDKRRPVPVDTLANKLTPMSHAAQLGLVSVQTSELSAQISKLEHELALASRQGRNPPPCIADDCEKRFQTMIRPAMLRAEVGIRRLALARLKATATPAYQSRFVSMLASGSLDRFLQYTREQQKRKASAIYLAAFDEALRAVESKQHSQPTRLLADDLKRKRANLQELVSRANTLPLSAAQTAMFSEDQPRQSQ